jgi:hypothetical protein
MSLRVVGGLCLLDLRRLMRSWRWRILAVLVVGLVIGMQQLESFGVGVPADFPGGALGLRLLGCLLAVGAAVLGVDLAGQPAHFGSIEMEQARPASGLLVGMSRQFALFLAGVPVLVLALVASQVPVFSGTWPLTWTPFVLWAAAVGGPLIWSAAGCGLLGRTLARTDAGGAAVALVLLAPLAWFRLWYAQPEDLFTLLSPHLGLLVPRGVLLEDAAITFGAGLATLGATGLLYRQPQPRTALRQLSPPRRSAFGAVASAMRRALAIPRQNGIAAVVGCGVLLVAGGWASLPAGRVVAATLAGRPPLVAEANWRAMRMPDDAREGVVSAPRFLHRRLVLPGVAREPLVVELTLAARGREVQPLAGVSFGPMLGLAGPPVADHGGVEVIGNALSSSVGMILRFDPPLEAQTPRVVRFTLTPRPEARRYWARAFHERFASWRPVPHWHGDGVEVNYVRPGWRIVREATPYELDAPQLHGRQWISGTAQATSRNGRVVLTEDIPDVPSGPFAADVVRIERTHGELAVTWLVLPEHAGLADALQTVYSRRFERLGRAFGPPAAPILFAEVPGVHRHGDSTSIPSAWLDRLALRLADYDDFRAPTAPEFDAFFAQLNRQALQQLFDRTFAGFEEPAFLRDAWIEYLHSFAFDGAQSLRDLERRRRDFIFVPWEWLTGPRRAAFVILPRDEPGYRGPIFDRPSSLPPVPAGRLLALHHMVRGLLGDDGWRAMTRELFAEGRGEPLTLARYRQVAARQAPGEFGAFFGQWVEEGVVPTYALERAEVVLAEDPLSRRFDYFTRVVVANRGDGELTVPVVLRTDGDVVRQRIVLRADESTTLTLRTRERPLSIEVDPDGWVVQRLPLDPLTRKPQRPRLFLKSLRELGPGEPLPWIQEDANLVQAPTGQVSMDGVASAGERNISQAAPVGPTGE